MATDKVVFDTKDCTGCKTCAIACSYHHQGVFTLAISSVEIKDLRQEGKFQIVFHTKNASGHLACDRCQGENEPLCVKYCVMRQELKAILGSYLTEK